MPSASVLNRSLELAETLPALMVAADRVAATVIQGVHGRRRVGQGDAFWQYRPYREGDSVSRIDWRQSARSRNLFVRETEWEAAASVWLWRDASPSMQYASLRNLETKAERAELITLALASLLTDASERIALLGSGLRPSTGRIAVRRVAEALFAERSRGAGPSSSLPPLVPLPAHGTIVLVSDWLDPLDQIEAMIRHYASAGVRGHLVQVLDPAEEDLPFQGHVKFEGLEAEGQHTIRRVEGVRAAYSARLAAQREGLQRLARPADWTVHLHRTDRPPQTILLSLYLAMADLRRLNAA
ncbi:Protein of unknown function DUF58 [Enhydrobacter aerosaccus]|uniref:DUF58 domain-containing protein n=1 Tax=Enhydrobacter aerosaccus TaxID=225324 RepID=A0A1T4PEE5_9HYPH|nr:DUF58 domain-containing protein [Enhydrobacter aerosaccus]SJZ89606.1 Protein of unknown function DUF58 [Enhydrobacter aerosaccus]